MRVSSMKLCMRKIRTILLHDYDVVSTLAAVLRCDESEGQCPMIWNFKIKNSFVPKSKYSDRSIKMKLLILLKNYDRQRPSHLQHIYFT